MAVDITQLETDVTALSQAVAALGTALDAFIAAQQPPALDAVDATVTQTTASVQALEAKVSPPPAA